MPRPPPVEAEMTQAAQGPRGYIGITVLNIGGRRNRAEAQQAFLDECSNVRHGLTLWQEWDEGIHRLPESCIKIKGDYLVTSLNRSLGTLELEAVHFVDGKRHPKPWSQTELMSCKATLNPPRAGLQELRIINIHFHNRMASLGEKGNFDQRNLIWDWVAEQAKKDATPCIFGGDFNSRWHQVEENMRERNVECTPLVMPKGAQPGDTPRTCRNDEYLDCICLFWLGSRDKLPAKRKVTYWDNFDPARHLVGHGAHWPISCFLSAGQPIRSQEGAERKRLKREARAKAKALRS